MAGTEKAQKIAEDALAQLAAELEAGRSETLKNYLAAMGRFRRYSWGNVLMIHSQRPTATQVAGFQAWHQLGRSVKSGEKGILIFAPMVKKRQDQSVEPADIKSNDVLRVSGFRTVYVFDFAQTEGQPLPAFASTPGDPKDYGDKLKAIVAKRGISLQYDHSITPAQGVSSGGQIRLLPNLAPAEEFSVLTHELAHEMLHHDKNAAPLSKRVRETQAEAVAFVVVKTAGLETNTAAADYISLYQGDKNTLAESFSAIQEASAKILEELVEEDRPRPSAEFKNQAPEPASSEHQPPGQDESASWSR